MIDQKRNQRLWQACGWKLNNPDAPKYLRIYLDPTGELVPLPTPSDPVPFIGYLEK